MSRFGSLLWLLLKPGRAFLKATHAHHPDHTHSRHGGIVARGLRSGRAAMKALSNIAIILSLIHSSLRRPHARNCSPNLRPPAITGGRREPYRASAPYNQMTFSRYQAVPDRYMRDCVARRSQQRFTPPVRSQALAKREGIVATQYVSWGL
jgi:hypothetical protein